MRRVTVTQLKNQLSRYLRMVKQGETLEVVERAVPIARMEGIERDGSGRDSHLNRLLRDGIVTGASRSASKDWLKKPPLGSKVDPVKVMVEERNRR